MAAVSARRMPGPKPTTGYPPGQLGIVPPALGPDGHGGHGHARWIAPGVGQASGAGATTSAIRPTRGPHHLGQPRAPALGGGLPGHPAQALDRPGPAVASHRHDGPGRAQNGDAVDPGLRSASAPPTPDVALHGDEADGERRRRRGRDGNGSVDVEDLPTGSHRRPAARAPVPAQAPATLAVSGHHRLVGPQPEHPGQVMGVVGVRMGWSRSAT